MREIIAEPQNGAANFGWAASGRMGREYEERASLGSQALEKASK